MCHADLSSTGGQHSITIFRQPYWYILENAGGKKDRYVNST